jgi:cellulose synthase/poly-beta-1,6-N-acetylglucosamine synthase-like glycosyltransferase
MKNQNQTRIAVVTPYYQENLDILKKCQESVRQQTYLCTHFMVADGFPRDEIASWPVALRWPRTGGFPAGRFYAATAGAFSASYTSGER